MVSKRLLKISKLNPNYQVSFKKKIIKYLHHFCSKDLLREKQNLNNKPVSFIIKKSYYGKRHTAPRPTEI